MTESIYNKIISKEIFEHLALAKKVRKAKGLGAKDSSDEAYAFILAALHILFPKISYAKLSKCITDCQGDLDIDAIVFDRETEGIYVFDFEGTSSLAYQSIKSFADNSVAFLLSEAKEPERFVRPELITKARRLRKNKNWRVHLGVIRAKRLNEKDVADYDKFLKVQLREYGLADSFGVWDSQRLVAKEIGSDAPTPKYEWKVQGLRSASPRILIEERDSADAIFFLTSLKNIVELSKLYVENGWNLFDANVRGFQKSHELSEEMQRAVVAQPKNFFKFHNGITFACDRIVPLTQSEYKIVSPQVINGCQTINILREASDCIPRAKLAKASILCKVYVLRDKAVEKVCEATNTQVKISPWDLRSNDDIQKHIEKFFKVNKVSYLRKSGYPKERDSVSMPTMGQWLYACVHGQPTLAKNKKRQLFEVISDKPKYNDIFHKNISPEALLDAYRIGNFVKKQLKGDKKKKPLENNASFHIMAAIYHLHAAAGDASSSEDESNLLQKYNKALDAVRAALLTLTRSWPEEEKSNYNRIFTKEESTWKLIKRELHR